MTTEKEALLVSLTPQICRTDDARFMGRSGILVFNCSHLLLCDFGGAGRRAGSLLHTAPSCQQQPYPSFIQFTVMGGFSSFLSKQDEP